MRSEQEIRRAIRHLTMAAEEPLGLLHFIPAAAAMSSQADLLKWVLGEPSDFEKGVMEPCDAIDKAESN